MFREQIKQQTQPSHTQLEKRIILYIKESQDVASYANLLRKYYGFMKPVEGRIARTVDTHVLGDLNRRLRAPILLDDIEALEGDVSVAIRACTDLPEINNLAQALGALYVLEGSTMGGPHIRTMLLRRLPVANAVDYFGGYGDDNARMWQKFVGVLTHERFASHQSTIIQAANETFSKFDRWLADSL